MKKIKFKFTMHEMDIVRELEILRYLLEQINQMEDFTKGCDEELFLRNELVKNATLMKLLVFGEYSAHLSDKLKERFSDIQWQLIKAARNYYAHVYRGVNWTTVWAVIEQELPGLKAKIEHIIEVLENENNGKTN